MAIAEKPVYLVESVGMGRRIKIHRRSVNYDVVNELFTSMRKFPCRELRMVKVLAGAHTILKYISRTRILESSND